LFFFGVGISTYGTYRRVSGADVYIAGFVTVKVLQAFRIFLFTLCSFVSHVKYPINKEARTAFIYTNALIINKLFMVNALRVVLAIIWLILVFIVGLLMRPFWANLLLFGRYNGTEKQIELKVGNKSIILPQYDFKRIQALPSPSDDYNDPKPLISDSQDKRVRIWTVTHDAKLSTAIDPREVQSRSRKPSIFEKLRPSISGSTRLLTSITKPPVKEVDVQQPLLEKSSSVSSSPDEGEKSTYQPPKMPIVKHKPIGELPKSPEKGEDQ